MRYNEHKDRRIVEYMLANEKARYKAIKAITKCVKHIAIALIVSIAVVLCCYFYFVVPVEEVEVNNGSNAVLNTNIDNGSEVWQ